MPTTTAASLFYGQPVRSLQLRRHLEVFSAWRPAVEELRLTARGRAPNNPFAELPGEVLRLIEDALWDAIDPRQDPEGPVFAFLGGKVEVTWPDETLQQIAVRLRGELRRLFGVSVVHVTSHHFGVDSDPVWFLALERHREHLAKVHDLEDEDTDVARLPDGYLTVTEEEKTRIGTAAGGLRLDALSLPCLPPGRREEAEARAAIDGAAEPAWFAGQVIYETYR
ncbi:hypothetical protein DFJ74DRAFT_703388 [Hyaloraphidium curvatum]|nr:hypothetical protein DFJ74DRAFT_703388 [Hyaloraphidium curvatum]